MSLSPVNGWSETFATTITWSTATSAATTMAPASGPFAVSLTLGEHASSSLFPRSAPHTHTHTHPSVPEIIAPFTELYYSSRELLPRDNRGPLATNLGGPNNSTPIHYFYCGGSKCPLGSIFKGTNEEIEGLCPPGALWCTLVPALTFTSQSKAVPTHKLVHTDVYTKAQCLLEHHMVRQKAIKYAEEQTT